jgi:flagellar biosynthesis protein FliR
MDWNTLEPLLSSFLFGYLKAAAFICLLPLGSGSLAAPRKAALACGLALMLMSAPPATLYQSDGFQLAVEGGRHIAHGLLVALPLALASASIRLWADWLELLRGEQLASVLEPGSQRPQSLLGLFVAQFFTCALLFGGALEQSLLALGSSQPPISGLSVGELGAALVNVGLSTISFAASLHIGLAATFFAIELGQAVLSKILPQVICFQELFIVKWCLSLLLLAGLGAEVLPRFLRFRRELALALGVA